ncbi:MAG TPA: outer membrane protein assembly factor BamD, partial [Gammaproteobacteria bacterium]|nr:outer membrane protein assembly factor BamD [Gammaproteobacteria bacterium]
LVLGGLAALALGCASHKENVVKDAGPEALYDRGSNMMRGANYQGAIQNFLQLESRYPFSPETRQAQLDLIYAYYKSNQPEAAIDAAEQFERENPTHPRVDYALYMRGLVYFDQAPNILEKMFHVDMTARPPKDSLKAFSTFQELIRRFPNSEYVPDAQERMVFLRNRLASSENHVATSYMRRGAYVAAANRAKYALEHYPGAPELQDTLQLLVQAYQALGMNDLAADAQRVYDSNFGPRAATADLND